MKEIGRSRCSARRHESGQPAPSCFFLNFFLSAGKHVFNRPMTFAPQTIGANRMGLPNQCSQRLCPVLCPPPNPTDCDRLLPNRWKPLCSMTSVTFRIVQYNSVQLVGFSFRKSDLEKIRASADVTCPQCGARIPPERQQRVDWDHLQCPNCGERFVPKSSGPR